MSRLAGAESETKLGRRLTVARPLGWSSTWPWSSRAKSVMSRTLMPTWRNKQCGRGRRRQARDIREENVCSHRERIDGVSTTLSQKVCLNIVNCSAFWSRFVGRRIRKSDCILQRVSLQQKFFASETQPLRYYSNSYFVAHFWQAIAVSCSQVSNLDLDSVQELGTVPYRKASAYSTREGYVG